MLNNNLKPIAVLSLLIIALIHPGIASSDVLIGQIHEEKIGQILVTGEDENSITLYWKMSDEIISGFEGGMKYSNLYYSERGISFESGEPDLSVLSRMIGVPVDGNYTLEIVKDEITVIKGNFKFKGCRIPAVNDESFEPGLYTTKVIDGLCPDHSILPANAVVISQDGWLRNQRFIKVDFYPIQFNLDEGSIIIHSQLEIRVKFSGFIETSTQSKTQSTIPINLYEKFLERQLVNYKTARNWRGYPSKDINKEIRYSNVNKSILPTSLNVIDTPRLRIAISEDGLYRVTYDDLVSFGMAGVDPMTFHLSMQGSDQAYFLLNDDGDHILDPNEELLFWGEKFTGGRLAELYSNEDINWGTFVRQLEDGSYHNWHPQFNAVMLEKYTNQNIYWLSWGGTPGPLMQVVDGEPGVAPNVTIFPEHVTYDEDNLWRTHPFTSEETWFRDLIEIAPDETISRKYPFEIYTPDFSGEIAVISGEVMAATNNDSLPDDHHIRMFINNQSNYPNDFFWDGKSRIGFSFQVPVELLIDGLNELNLEAISTENITGEKLYFDWFSIAYSRLLESISGELFLKNLDTSSKKIKVNGFGNSQVVVLDLMDHNLPKWVEKYSVTTTPNIFSNTGDLTETYSVEIEGSSSEYYFVELGRTKTPDDLKLVEPSTFINESVPDYLFITSAQLAEATYQLADYRSSESLNTQVITIETLYDNFNFGIRHPIAIKNYIRYLLDEKGDLPEYVLLVGDGHWNLKSAPNHGNSIQHIPPNLSWVDPWQGEVDSANLLATVVGDDPLADLSIGRLPVNTQEEVIGYLNKIKVYEQTSTTGWQQKFSFVADNPDSAGDFEALSDGIIQDYFMPNDGRIVNKYYLSEFNKDAETLKSELIFNINSPGYGVITYTGHGSIQHWASESIFSTADIANLNNNANYPLVLSMTCLDGYWIHPDEPSLIEDLIRVKDKGAVAAFSPSGLGVASGHDTLLRGIFNSFFIEDEWIIGIAGDFSKQKLYLENHDFDLLHTYTVFGDPMLKIKDGPLMMFIPISLRNGR